MPGDFFGTVYYSPDFGTDKCKVMYSHAVAHVFALMDAKFKTHAQNDVCASDLTDQGHLEDDLAGQGHSGSHAGCIHEWKTY